MARESNLFPPNPPEPPERFSALGGARVRQTAAERHQIHWMVRVEAIIRILVRLYLGLLVLVLPWLPFWAQNNLFTYDAVLFTLANNGFVRGVVSGLGLLNVILAVLEAKNARELS